MAEQELEQSMDFGDYVAAFKRRWGLIATVAILVFIPGLIIAYTLPPTYQSSATILIEAQEVPAELIRSTVTSFASQRIQVISQRVMTRTNLVKIMDEYGLYADDRKRKSIEQILGKMRSDISINMITAEVVDPRTGRPGSATIAFTLGYKSESPVQAQKVANEMTTLFLNENLRTRTEEAAETYDFLTTEANRLKDEIYKLESQLATFKAANLNILPESRTLNTQSLDRAEREVATIDTRLQSLNERKIYLEGQLALLDPYGSGATMSPKARLKALRTEYISLASRYSPDHPDITRIKHEIKALEMETGDYASPEDRHAQLDLLQKELAIAEQTYTNEHPDVKRLRRQVATLEDEINNPSPATTKIDTAINADNPAYVNMHSQLAIANSEINSQMSRRTKVIDKIEVYEERLLQIPKIEQEYRAITRDLGHATQRYQEIKAKQMTAAVGQEMEEERKGEKFTLIDPAVLPGEPISPNRPSIVFLSLVLALGSGFGIAVALETMNAAVRGVKGVVGVLQTAPLAVIPYLPNASDMRARQNKKRIWLIALVATIITLVLLVHFLYTPLDVLWFRGMRKVDTLMGE